MRKLIRFGGPQHAVREELARFEQLAREWHDRARSRALLLPRSVTRRGQRAVAAAAGLGLSPSAKLDDLLAASRRAGRWRLGAQLASTLLAVGLVGWGVQRWEPSRDDAKPLVDASPRVVPRPDEVPPEPPAPRSAFTEWIEHAVIPEESLQDVAERYGVSPAMVARWNSIDPEQPLLPKQTLRIKPEKRPLPQQEIRYEVERGDTWTRLSERFGVTLSKLRAYNPNAGERLRKGQEIAVWIDPTPHPPPSERKPIPEFSTRDDAISHGSPNGGWLENGIQLPSSELYVRRKPNLMYGSGHTVRHLMRGIAMFRRDMAFDGVVVIMDMSRREGGFFPPHKSHQSGRDADVWLPTLRGVYKKDHLGKDRRPLPNEVDWYATWGLVKALVDTGEVHTVFIDYSLMPSVYQAAAMSGVPESTLEEIIQWPRPKFASGGILRHSENHTRHIHVRFRCGPNDVGCNNSTVTP